MRKYIETLNPQKATGQDEISPKLLKLAGQSVTAPLTVIFNQSLRETSVPSTWKCARIKTTHKKGDITERENYRPLSILSVPSKIMEKCVVDKLDEHTSENNNLVNSSQWAYKKGVFNRTSTCQFDGKMAFCTRSKKNRLCCVHRFP